jgi:hypothetical protein
MRRLGLLLAPLVLAGCMGGGTAKPAPHGIYQADVTLGAGPTHTVWLDVDSGRFRAAVSGGHGRKVTTSDGRTAVTRFRGFTTRTTGSPAFLEATADPAVQVLRDRLEGTPVPAGDSVAGLHRVRGTSADLFALENAPAPSMIVRQIDVGSVPSAGPLAYWLGAKFAGKRPLYASTTRGKGFAAYAVSYPGVDVEVEASRFRIPTCHATHVVLADGTPAVMTLVTPDLGPCETSDGTGTSSIAVFGFSTEWPGGLAIVGAAGRTILLSGPAVTQKSAVRLARALRPV